MAVRDPSGMCERRGSGRTGPPPRGLSVSIADPPRGACCASVHEHGWTGARGHPPTYGFGYLCQQDAVRHAWLIRSADGSWLGAEVPTARPARARPQQHGAAPQFPDHGCVATGLGQVDHLQRVAGAVVQLVHAIQGVPAVGPPGGAHTAHGKAVVRLGPRGRRCCVLAVAVPAGFGFLGPGPDDGSDIVNPPTSGPGGQTDEPCTVPGRCRGDPRARRDDVAPGCRSRSARRWLLSGLRTTTSARMGRWD